MEMIEKIYTIYSLVNLDNGKRYIGRTKQLDTRIKVHMNALKSHRHSNPYLNEDSSCQFTYEVLETGIKGLREGKLREQYYMVQFKTYDADYGYNVNDWGMKRYRKELQAKQGRSMNPYLFQGLWLEADSITKENIKLMLNAFETKDENAPLSTAIPSRAE